MQIARSLAQVQRDPMTHPLDVPAPLGRKDLTYLCKAAELARHSKLRVRVGAITHHFYTGWNVRRSHPKLAEWGYPENSDIHAEAFLALYGYETMMGAEVYVARLLRDDSWGLAKPCDVCMSLLVQAGVKRVVWTTGPAAGEGVRL